MAAADQPPRPDRKPQRAGAAFQVRGAGHRQRRPLRRRRLTLFGFVQLDFAGALPLVDGRYLVRSPGPDAEESVLVVQRLGAPPAPPRRRRRVRRLESPEPEAVTLTRVTAIRAFAKFGSEEDAARWLDEACEAEDTVDVLAAEAVALLNRALHAQAVSTANPGSRAELAAEDAERVAIGYGSGEETADGRFTDARHADVRAGASRRRRREEELRPQERVAGVLSGREQLDACETLLLRARADLDAGRYREGALQLRVGLEALLVELKGALADPGHEEDMGTLSARKSEVGEAANTALRGELTGEQRHQVEELLGIGERVLRRRRVLQG